MAEQAAPLPHCPYCDAEQAGLGLFNWQAGVWMILAVYCAHCKKILNMSVLPMMAGEEPRVQIPS